jgi:hypothetical protein
VTNNIENNVVVDVVGLEKSFGKSSSDITLSKETK